MNQQLTLLAEPRARLTDPLTAQRAAQVVAKAGGALERRIAETVTESRCPLTAEQIAHEITASTGRWGHGSIETAVSRTRELGWIIPVGEGRTSRGRDAVLYDSPERAR